MGTSLSCLSPISRMDSVFTPESINLHFYFNLEAYNFESKADVTGKLNKDTNEIPVYAKRLQFLKVEWKHGDHMVTAEDYFYDEDREMMIFMFPENLKTGPGHLVLSYVSEISDQFRGLYYINFDRHQVERDRKLDRMKMRLMWERGTDMETEAEMEKEMERMEEMYQFMIVGNFHWAECMRAFPSWYHQKIKYYISVECQQELRVFSNMMEKKNHHEYTFEEYETHSPMRLCFAIGNFQSQETKGESLLRFHSVMEDQKYLETAKERANMLMNRLKSPWPMKIDFVEVPDLCQEYCINAGLSLFRETYLMASRESSAKVRFQIRRAVSHSMAAQYIYASEKAEHESLWTLFGHFLMDYDMDMLKVFYTDVIAPAMDDDMPRDMTDNYQDDMYHQRMRDNEKKYKVMYDLRRWEKIDAKKRASHMLAKWMMEPENFQKLERMSQNNDASFWQALLKKFMSYSDLKEREHFPLLKVTWTKDGDNVNMKFHQVYYYGKEGDEQFNMDHQPESAWPLNLKIFRKGKQEGNVSMNSVGGEMKFCSFTDQDWVFVDGMDFFRTEYDEEMLEHLMMGVRDHSLPSTCRMRLQNDLFALTRDSRMSLHRLIKYLMDYVNEPDYYIWLDMVRNFESMHQLLQNKRSYDIWVKFAVPFFHNIWKNVGWDRKQNEQPIMTMLRGELLAVLGRFGDHEIVLEARRRFHHFMKHREYLDTNIRYGVYVTVLANENGRETFDQLMKMYESVQWKEERNRMQEAFGSVKRRNLLREVARLSMSRTVCKQDCARILRGMTHSLQGRDVAWQFYKNHWQWFDTQFRYTPMEVEIIKLLVHKFAAADQLEDVQKFFENHMPSCGYRFLQKYYWRIKFNMEWKHPELDETMQFVESNMKHHF